MAYDSYPAGMSTQDLIHVGELSDSGESDFFSDYTPDEEQLSEWLSEDPDGAIKTISSFSNGLGILNAAWCEANESVIQKEWDERNE